MTFDEKIQEIKEWIQREKELEEKGKDYIPDKNMRFICEVLVEMRDRIRTHVEF